MTARPALVAFLVAALPMSAAAAGVVFTQPEAGVSLHGGDLVEIRWSGVPRDSDEVELLLSVDGGRHFSLRLTEELDANSRFFLWRVPNLIAETAALALRTGIEGREVESASGPLFHVSPGSSEPMALLRFRSEEIWVDTPEEGACERAGDSLPVTGLSAEGERLIASPRWAGAFLSSRTFVSRPALAARKSFARGTVETAAPAVPWLSRSPRSIPQRI